MNQNINNNGVNTLFSSTSTTPTITPTPTLTATIHNFSTTPPNSFSIDLTLLDQMSKKFRDDEKNNYKNNPHNPANRFNQGQNSFPAVKLDFSNPSTSNR